MSRFKLRIERGDIYTKPCPWWSSIKVAIQAVRALSQRVFLPPDPARSYRLFFSLSLKDWSLEVRNQCVPLHKLLACVSLHWQSDANFFHVTIFLVFYEVVSLFCTSAIPIVFDTIMIFLPKKIRFHSCLDYV